MTTHLGARRFFVLIAAAALLTGCATASPETESTLDTLVSVEWLEEHLDDPDLVVLDCSVHVEMGEQGGFQILSGRVDYDESHIPGAGFADLLGDISDGDSPLRFALPAPEQFAAAMGNLGVGDDSRVVLYSRQNPAWAARVWWMLRWVGFDRAALLDGGLGAWTAQGGTLSTEPARRSARRLTPAPRPELVADRDEVLAAVDDDNVWIIDALPAASYRGEMTMYERGGHIPGASNIPASALNDESGFFRPLDELAALHDRDRNSRAITYCGGGISASSNAFVMTRLGYTDVAVYIASLQEWAADPALPLVTSTP